MSTNFSTVPVMNIKPARQEKSRKDIFVDKLKGKTLCKVDPKAPEGVTFSICNEVTQEIQTICKINGQWLIWGTVAYPAMTNIELEEYMTEQLESIFKNGDDSKMLRMMDNYGILEFYN